VTSLKNCLVNQQRGQYVKKNVIEPVGVCDYSGFFFSRSDLVKQYEWRGNQLVWTGAIVGRPFADEPNEQNRPPQIKGDPKTVQNPRPFGIETPQGPEATGNNSAVVLENINFTSEGIPPVLSDFAGENVSSLDDQERLGSLHQIRF
jgi:hypothetical protein